MKDFNIFYSWQSDTNPKLNNYFIRDCLDKVVKDLSKESTLKIVPRLDKDTLGETGSPNIVETIFRKIDGCQILVVDVTLINNDAITRILGRRLAPNPNVLVELGYGLYRLSWDRVICINNSALSRIEDLPFDIKQNRISQYTLGNSNSKEKVKKKLTDLLRSAIQMIIDKYDVIEERTKSSSVQSHDILIFKEIDKIIMDDSFITLLQTIANNQMLTQDDYALFDKISRFLKADKNRFLLPVLDERALGFQKSLSTMSSTFAVNFHSKYDEWIDEQGETQSQITYTFSDQLDYKRRDEKLEENLNAIQGAVLKYKSFRQSIKESLFI